MKHTHIHIGTGVSQDVISDKGQYPVPSCHLIVSLSAYWVRLCGVDGKYWGAPSMEYIVAGFIKPESCHLRAHGSSLAVLTVGKPGIMVCVEERAASLPKMTTMNSTLSSF